MLSASSLARVETAVAYFAENEKAFRRKRGVIRFEGGWVKAAGGMKKPPETYREGRLMFARAVRIGLPEEFGVAGIESTSTMSNMLRARSQFLSVDQLAIVTQQSQADRLFYCAGKVFPDTELSIIEAPGEENEAIYANEAKLLKQSRLLYGWAWGQRTLQFADMAGTLLANIAGWNPAAEFSHTK
jgi:hypothetical protein